MRQGTGWLMGVSTGLVVVGFLLRLLLPSTIPYLLIGIACIIPPALCLLYAGLAGRISQLLMILVYVASSVALVWFFVMEGDHLLPYDAMTGSGSVYGHSVAASGNYLAAWTGLVLALMGIVAAWILAADALSSRRAARARKSGAGPHRRRPHGTNRP